MTNLGIINQFFNERIRLVDGNTKPLLQKLKSICEKRASGQISEQQALIDIQKISGVNTQGILGGMNFEPVMNPFAGVRTNQKKKKAVMDGLFDFGNKEKVHQFPVLGLKPLNSNSSKKRFVVTPMSRSWFDVKDFKKQDPVVGGLAKKVTQNRFDESNKAMKNMFNQAKQNMNMQPVLKGMTTPVNPRKGKRSFKRNPQSVAEMMGWKI